MKNIKYVIIQAGGKGTRMGKYTKNKPKALVSINNKPMIFYTFEAFKESKFIIISDYKKEVMKEYLKCFAEVEYDIVETHKKGTCAGIEKALSLIPKGEKFALIWSDLIINKALTNKPKANVQYIGISKNFECRWSYRCGELIESKSTVDGVAGFFLFSSSQIIRDVPQEGEFVRYLSHKKLAFEKMILNDVDEFGLIETYEKSKDDSNMFKCRPFNQMWIDGSEVEKKGITEQGKKLAAKESAWYRFCNQKGNAEVKNYLPRISGYDPLRMERIYGKQPFNCEFKGEEKAKVLKYVLDGLMSIHNMAGSICADKNCCINEYYYKTINRVKTVENLIPFLKEKEICRNGKRCLNPWWEKEELQMLAEDYLPEKFVPIHGDCTFSNTIIGENGNKIYFIDPRGYFGSSQIYGDEDYDWSKVYYSLSGNYDLFNRGKFELIIEESQVELVIQDEGWMDMEDLFFSTIGEDKKEKILFLQCIIWMSLTTYAWDDYDAICAAYYNGVLQYNKYKEYIYAKENAKSN